MRAMGAEVCRLELSYNPFEILANSIICHGPQLGPSWVSARPQLGPSQASEGQPLSPEDS